MFSDQDERAWHELAKEVAQNKQSANESAATPRVSDVIALLFPLSPHANAIFEKCAHKTETCDGRQIVFAVFKRLQKKGKEDKHDVKFESTKDEKERENKATVSAMSSALFIHSRCSLDTFMFMLFRFISFTFFSVE
jgi:hypothetical protein